MRKETANDQSVGDHLIWWTANDASPVFRPGTPIYIKDQWCSRKGRNGRGRLWVDRSFGIAVQVEPWIENPFAQRLAMYYGGIVIMRQDHQYVSGLQGVVTDLQLQIQSEFDSMGTQEIRDLIETWK